MSKRILVTGGAGFIGSHLCERLLALGDEVICLDDFYTGRRHNVAHLLSNPRFELVRHDVRLPYSLEVDEIFNLACPASPPHYQRDPVRTLETSVKGMLHALELARRVGARVLQASTSEVYGDPKVHPQTENYVGHVSCTGVRACYDEGKRAAETLCFDYHRQCGVDVRVSRIFNTYGPRMLADDGRVISNFIVQALRGEPITVYGTGRQTRSFCYVADLVDGLLLHMSSPHPGPVNLGNPRELTVNDLAERILGMTGSTSVIVQQPSPPDDPRQRRPDIMLAQTDLRWTPRVELEEGLERTIAHFKDQLGTEVARQTRGVA
jgi:UDP-glucuronate decarboxylase